MKIFRKSFIFFTFLLIVQASFANGLNSLCLTGNGFLWVVGSNGQMLRSGDGGITFQDRSIGTNNYNDVTCFQFNIWVACDSGIIFTSTNTGFSFISYNVGSNENLRSVCYINNILWAAGNNGNIYKSTNNGVNWVQQSIPATANLHTIKFTNSSTGAACGTGNTILISTNGGDSWSTSLLPVNNEKLSMDIKGNTIMVSCADGIVLRSNNLGINWTIIDYNILTKSDVNSVFMTNPNTFYSCGTGGFIRKSTDGGNTFIYQNNPLLIDLNKIYFFDSTQGWAISKNGKIVLRTSAAGAIWHYPQGVTQSFSWSLKIPLSFYTSSGNVFFQSTWNKKEIFVTNSNKVYRSLNTGDNWVQIGSQMPNGRISNSFFVSSKDTNIFLAAIDSSDNFHGWVLRSTNYGQTWNSTLSANRSSDGTPLAVDPNHPDTIYYGPTDSTLFRSTNFGLTWAPVGTQHFDNICIIKVLEGNSNVILVGGAGSIQDLTARLLRSTDYGLSWTVVDSNTGEIPEYPELPAIATSTLSPIIYSANYDGDYGGVKRSLNQGASWNNVNLDNSVWGIDVAKDDPNAFAYGPFYELLGYPAAYLTLDKGIHFTELPSAGTVGNFAVYYYNRNTLFLQQTTGFYKLNVNINSPIGIQPITNEVPNEFSLSQNYPNPFNPKTKINFQIPINTFVNLSIYDILGREVQVPINREMKSGSYEIGWDASDFASGIYFYHFITEGFSLTKKMVLVK